MTTLRQNAPEIKAVLDKASIQDGDIPLINRFGANIAYVLEDASLLQAALSGNVRADLVYYLAVQLGIFPTEDGNITLHAPSNLETIEQ